MVDVIIVDPRNSVAGFSHLSGVEFIILIPLQLSLSDENHMTNNFRGLVSRLKGAIAWA